MKKYILLTLVLVTISALFYVFLYGSSTQNVNYETSAKQKAENIKGALQLYINETGDLKLENLKIVSGETKTNELINLLQ